MAFKLSAFLLSPNRSAENLSDLLLLFTTNKLKIEQLKQKFIETEAAAGAESDKDAKIAELETAVNAKNEELEAKNQEQSSLQAASQGFKNI